MSFSLKSGKPDYVLENTLGSEENMVERKKNKPNPCIVICQGNKSSAGRIGGVMVLNTAPNWYPKSVS